MGGLLALYAAMQWASVVHSAQHVSPDRAVPHALVCTFCVAAFETGGAPMAEPPTLRLLPARAAAPDASPLLPLGTAMAVRYRSRAPPTLT